jgi:subtilisin family serine protease
MLAPALALAAAVGLTGCATVAMPHAAAPLPSTALAHPENYVVVTVRNSPAALNPFAASTPRGYGGFHPYRASTAATESAQGIARRHMLRAVAAWPIELLSVHCVVYELPADAPREQVLAALRDDAAVESVQPLGRFTVQATAYTDAYADLQRNLVEMDVAAAQQSSLGDGVRVAIVDTAVDTGHPDFGGRVAAVRDFVADGRRAGERHGTAVAGIIAAVPNNGIGIAGIAPRATLIPLRGCWAARDDAEAGSCNTYTLAQSLAAALDARAALVNLSVGGPEDPLLRRIVERGLARGTVFVGAVPENGRREGFPSGIEGVIAVDVAGKAPPSPRTLLAPGLDVFTLSPHGRYDAASGSSVAAAGVTAVAALLLARRPGLEPREIEGILRRSMVGTPATSPSRATVNACLALRELVGGGACGSERLSARR